MKEVGIIITHTNTDIKVLTSSEYEGSLGRVLQMQTANDRQNKSAFIWFN